MENKLKLELDALPAPKTTFEALETMNCQQKPIRRWKKMVIMTAAVLALLLCGMGWAKSEMRYGMWVLYSSHGWDDVEWATKQMEIELPEAMDGVPFRTYWVYGHVPQGESLLRALVSPLYTPASVAYGYQMRETETYPDGSLASEAVWDETELGLNFGTTENELWRYYFQMDETGVWTAWDVPGSYHTIEYRGITLQIGDTSFYDDVLGQTRFTHWVHWVDEEKQIAFSINETDYTDPNRVVECAKVIIDLNSR